MNAIPKHLNGKPFESLSVIEQRDWALTRLQEVTAELAAYRNRDAARDGDAFEAFVRDHLKLPAGEARVVLTLHQANGRFLTAEQINEGLRVTSRPREDVDLRTVTTRICIIRRAMGKAAIRSQWGGFYALAPEAMQRVNQLKTEFMGTMQ